MKVNGKEIKGIFLYSPDVLFSKGDFVVEQDNMFVCIEPSIGNSPSSTPDKFKPYLGGNVTDEISDGNTGLVSSYTLGQALSSISVNVNGMIENEITEDGKAFFRDYFGDESGIDLGDKYLNPLDNLIVSEINQTVMKVDKTVAAPIIGEVTNPPILRQYTYGTYTGRIRTLNRLQEMIDVDNGLIYFRRSFKLLLRGPEENSKWEAPSDWKCSTVSSNFGNILTSIRSNYLQKCNDLEIEKQRLHGSFKYKEVDFKEEGGRVALSSSTVGDIITVCIMYSEGNIKRTESLTINNLSNITEQVTYGTGGGKTIKVSKTQSEIVLEASECKIIDIYTRNVFTYTSAESGDIPTVRYNVSDAGKTANVLLTGNYLPYIELKFSDNRNIVFPIFIDNLSVSYDLRNSLNITRRDSLITITTQSLDFDFNKLSMRYVKLN